MPAGAITLADIASADWSLQLDFTTPSQAAGSGLGNVVQGLADIDQCIRIICTTPLGTDPFRPTFGADVFKFLDLPITIVTAHVVRILTDAILQWEPRAKVLSISVSLVTTGSQAGSQLQIAIAWQLRLAAPVSNGSPIQTTTIVLANGAA